MPHHWYPEGYIDPWTPPSPQTPVWKNTFKPYYTVPSAPHNGNGSYLPATSGPSGQAISSTPKSGNPPSPVQSLPRNTRRTRVSVTGPGSGSTSRSPLAQDADLTTSYQKTPSAVPPKVGSHRKAAHSSTIVPPSPSSLRPPPTEIGSVIKSFYNMSVAPSPQLGRLPRVDSTHGLSSVHSSKSTNTGGATILEPPAWDGVSEFIDGSTYFKIGEYVYVRRWHPTQKAYSKWLPGKVVRPDFCKTPDEREERRYVVSYQELLTGVQKEKTFSPSLNEIREVPANLGMPTVAVPAAHSAVFANANIQTSKMIIHQNSTVYALLQVKKDSKTYSVWTPSVCLAVEKPHGYRVRVIAGRLKNQTFSNVLEVMPYNAENAKGLRASGQRVEKSAVDPEH